MNRKGFCRYCKSLDEAHKKNYCNDSKDKDTFDCGWEGSPRWIERKAD